LTSPIALWQQVGTLDSFSKYQEYPGLFGSKLAYGVKTWAPPVVVHHLGTQDASNGRRSDRVFDACLSDFCDFGEPGLKRICTARFSGNLETYSLEIKQHTKGGLI